MLGTVILLWVRAKYDLVKRREITLEKKKTSGSTKASAWQTENSISQTEGKGSRTDLTGKEMECKFFGGTQHICTRWMTSMARVHHLSSSGTFFLFLKCHCSLQPLIASELRHWVDQVHLYQDISVVIRDVHVKGVMYKWVEKGLEQSILHGDEICAVLNCLVNHKKKLFLITSHIGLLWAGRQ